MQEETSNILLVIVLVIRIINSWKIDLQAIISFLLKRTRLLEVKSINLAINVIAGDISTPDCHVLHCADCENLIRRMLQVEPSRRLPLRDVKRHRWMRAAAEEAAGHARRGGPAASTSAAAAAGVSSHSGASLGAPPATATQLGPLPPPAPSSHQHQHQQLHQPPNTSSPQRPRASELAAAAAGTTPGTGGQCDREEPGNEELNEQALRHMTAAGISRDKTIDAIQRHAFDHYVCFVSH